MQYEEMRTWLSTLPRLAKHPGVENTKRLLEQLGNPQKNLRFVHVAGTNGKGSTVTMLANVLRCAGYCVGSNISPYVLDFKERFLLNGKMIDETTLCDVMSQVRTAIEALRAQGWDSFVEFDAVTAAAFLWYAQEKCDIVCLEVGLGGRLDSTNVIENTLIASIMAIGKDHTELLGDTYAEIATEKCGIFKQGCTAICYAPQPQEAMDTIVQCAKDANVNLIVPELEDLHRYKSNDFENHIDYGGYDLHLPFPGEHQAHNACVVVESALALCQQGFDISDEAIINGVETATFPARIEVLSKNPLVILDGAHNVDGATALAQTLKQANVSQLVAVIGVLKGKNPAEMLHILSPYIAKVIAVAPDHPRAIPAQELADLASLYVQQVNVCDSITQALDMAQAQNEHGCLICGSLYLAADARKHFIP